MSYSKKITPEEKYKKAQELFYGLNPNKVEGVKLNKEAADGGHQAAMLAYADILYKGDGIKQNKVEAAEYYEKAAETDRPILCEANCKLAGMSEK